MRLYIVQIPPTHDQGNHCMRFMCNRCEVRKEALWDYNSARAHDGLPSISRLPAGTTIRRAIGDRA